MLDAYIAVFLDGKLYIAPEDDTSNFFVKFLRQKRYRREANRFVYPLKHTIVEALGERYGINQQLDRPYDHIPVRGYGSDSRALDEDQHYRASGALAQNIDGVAAELRSSKLKFGTSYLRLSRPANPHKTTKYFALNGQPLVFDSDKFELDEETLAAMKRIRDNADQIIATQRGNHVSETWQMVVATIKRNSEMDKAAQGKLDDPRLYDLPLIEVGRQVVDAINGSRMNVRDVHCLGYLELCQLMRAAYDVADDSFYDNRLKDDIETVTDADVADPDSPYGPKDVGTLKDPFPVAPHRSI